MEQNFSSGVQVDDLFATTEIDPLRNIANFSPRQLRELADQREAYEHHSRVRRDQHIQPHGIGDVACTETHPKPFRKHGQSQGTSSRGNSESPAELSKANFSKLSLQTLPMASPQPLRPETAAKPSEPPLYVYPRTEHAHQALHSDNSGISVAGSENLCSHRLTASSGTSLKHPSSSNLPTPNLSDEQVLAESLVFTQHTPPPYESINALPKPVAIPQVMKGLTSPFTRAYAPVLSNHSISPAEFMSFIDGLNVVSTGNPILQAVNLGGMVAGLAPSAIAQLVGGVTQFGAQVATGAVSGIRSHDFLTAANQDFFHPRKLHVAIVDFKVLAEFINLPLGAASVAPLNAQTLDMTIMERRMAALRPYISDVTTDVPPRTAQATMLQKMCDRQVAKQAAKSEQKSKENRIKALEKAPVLSASGSGVAQGDGGAQLAQDATKEERKLNKDMNKIIREADKKIEKAQRRGATMKIQEEQTKRDKELAKVERDRAKKVKDSRKDYEKEDKEIKDGKKGKWLLVIPREGKLTQEPRTTFQKFVASVKD